MSCVRYSRRRNQVSFFLGVFKLIWRGMSLIPKNTEVLHHANLRKNLVLVRFYYRDLNWFVSWTILTLWGRCGLKRFVDFRVGREIDLNTGYLWWKGSASDRRYGPQWRWANKSLRRPILEFNLRRDTSTTGSENGVGQFWSSSGNFD